MFERERVHACVSMHMQTGGKERGELESQASPGLSAGPHARLNSWGHDLSKIKSQKFNPLSHQGTPVLLFYFLKDLFDYCRFKTYVGANCKIIW